jgi:phosphatidylserine decarboxylase
MSQSVGRGGGVIAAPGYRFILASLVLVILGLSTGWSWLTWLGFLGGGFSLTSSGTERLIPPEPDLIVSPADGKVVMVDEVQEDRF